MNGQMMNYKLYKESVKHTPEPVATRNPVQIDYKGLIAYASQKGLLPSDLSICEREKFIVTR